MSGVSRTQLVHWINDTFCLNIEKIDELGTGAVYCQIFDSIYGDVPLHKVHFDSKTRYEWEYNMKILQAIFVRHGIKREFDVSKLMKCKLQDNLDFMQWLYGFWLDQPKIPDYDPVARRAGTQLPYTSTNSNGQLRPRRSASALGTASSAGGSVSARQRSVSSGSNPANAARFDRYEEQIKQLQTENQELQSSVDVVVTEREFYYSKLLDIEELVKVQLDEIYDANGPDATMSPQNTPVVALLRKIQDILFSTPEGFESQPNIDEEPF